MWRWFKKKKVDTKIKQVFWGTLIKMWGLLSSSNTVQQLVNWNITTMNTSNNNMSITGNQSNSGYAFKFFKNLLSFGS